ncbi:unnamed protein product, partial [Ectocarpus sp. 12 AP-2014]
MSIIGGGVGGGACQSRPNEATKGGGCLCERRTMPITSYHTCSNQCPFVIGPLPARVTS